MGTVRKVRGTSEEKQEMRERGQVYPPKGKFPYGGFYSVYSNNRKPAFKNENL